MSWQQISQVCYVERKSQLDATQWFIELIIRSTCFGQYYAYHQELEIITDGYKMWREKLCSWSLVWDGAAGYVSE
jgi:hypothetical protein